MTRVTTEQASGAVSDASRRTRVAWRTRSTCRTDCDSRVCTTRCYRRTCISVAKVTFGAVTAQRWAVAVSSIPRHEARHARRYPAARADSDEVAVTRTRSAKCVPTENGKRGRWGRAFAALLEEACESVSGICRDVTENLRNSSISMLEFCQIQCAITKFIKPIGNLIKILIKSSDFR